MDILTDFLNTELSSKEVYEAIILFVTCVNIRNGEYEGNEYVILKVDQQNYIIYYESVDRSDGRSIHRCTSIVEKDLLHLLMEEAHRRDLI